MLPSIVMVAFDSWAVLMLFWCLPMMQQKRAPYRHFNDILPNVPAALSQTSPHCYILLLPHHHMAARARSGTLVAPGAPAKLQPRKGKDGFVADNVFAISSTVPEDVRAGVEAFEALDTKPFRRCLQIASRIASGDAIDERLLSETGDFFLSCTHEIVFCCVLRIALLVVARRRTCAPPTPALQALPKSQREQPSLLLFRSSQPYTAGMCVATCASLHAKLCKVLGIQRLFVAMPRLKMSITILHFSSALRCQPIPFISLHLMFFHVDFILYSSCSACELFFCVLNAIGAGVSKGHRCSGCLHPRCLHRQNQVSALCHLLFACQTHFKCSALEHAASACPTHRVPLIPLPFFPPSCLHHLTSATAPTKSLSRVYRASDGASASASLLPPAPAFCALSSSLKSLSPTAPSAQWK